MQCVVVVRIIRESVCHEKLKLSVHQARPHLLTDKVAGSLLQVEELACKKHLLVKHKHRGSEYVGLTDDYNIEFTAEGVWPMRDNPSQEGVPPNTQVQEGDAA